MRSYIVLSGIPVYLLGQKWKLKHQFMALKKKERKKKRSCNDSGKVQSRCTSPRLTSPSSWHCGPLTHGLVLNLVLSTFSPWQSLWSLWSPLVSLVSLVTCFWLPACLCWPAPLMRFWYLTQLLEADPWGLPLPNPRLGFKPEVQAPALLEPRAHPYLSFFQTLSCGDRTEAALGKYLQ